MADQPRRAYNHKPLTSSELSQFNRFFTTFLVLDEIRKVLKIDLKMKLSQEGVTNYNKFLRFLREEKNIEVNTASKYIMGFYIAPPIIPDVPQAPQISQDEALNVARQQMELDLEKIERENMLFIERQKQLHDMSSDERDLVFEKELTKRAEEKAKEVEEENKRIIAIKQIEAEVKKVEAETEAEIKKVEAEIKKAQIESEIKKAEAEAEIKKAEAEAEAEIKKAQIEAEIKKAQIEAEVKKVEAETEAEIKKIEAETKKDETETSRFKAELEEETKRFIEKEKTKRHQISANVIKFKILTDATLELFRESQRLYNRPLPSIPFKGYNDMSLSMFGKDDLKLVDIVDFSAKFITTFFNPRKIEDAEVSTENYMNGVLNLSFKTIMNDEEKYAMPVKSLLEFIEMGINEPTSSPVLKQKTEKLYVLTYDHKITIEEVRDILSADIENKYRIILEILKKRDIIDHNFMIKREYSLLMNKYNYMYGNKNIERFAKEMSSKLVEVLH
jgi:hypothetical protein